MKAESQLSPIVVVFVKARTLAINPPNLAPLLNFLKCTRRLLVYYKMDSFRPNSASWIIKLYIILLFSSNQYFLRVIVNGERVLRRRVDSFLPRRDRALRLTSEHSLFDGPAYLDQWGMRHFNVGVLLVSGTGSGFDLEKTSPAVDLALDYVNQVYLRPHRIVLDKVQSRYIFHNSDSEISRVPSDKSIHMLYLFL